MKTNNTLEKLYILVITLPLEKKEIIADLLERFDVTGHVSCLAYGSYSRETIKEVMFCAIKEKMVKDAILAIEDKFTSFRSNMSMVYAIPMESVIGLSSYMMLSNGGKK